jgi:hypothetical protein
VTDTLGSPQAVRRLCAFSVELCCLERLATSVVMRTNVVLGVQ